MFCHFPIIFPRWIAFLLQTCCGKKIMKIPMECDRDIVIGIKIGDKSFSTLSKVSLNENILKPLWKMPEITFWLRFFSEKACTLIAMFGLHCGRFQGFVQVFKYF